MLLFPVQLTYLRATIVLDLFCEIDKKPNLSLVTFISNRHRAYSKLDLCPFRGAEYEIIWSSRNEMKQ